MSIDATVERIADGLETQGWGTVMARWFEFEGPGKELSEEELERVARAYLRLIAKDALAALNDGDDTELRAIFGEPVEGRDFTRIDGYRDHSEAETTNND